MSWRKLVLCRWLRFLPFFRFRLLRDHRYPFCSFGRTRSSFHPVYCTKVNKSENQVGALYMNIVLSNSFVVTGWNALVSFAFLIHLKFILRKINYSKLPWWCWCKLHGPKNRILSTWWYQKVYSRLFFWLESQVNKQIFGKYLTIRKI